jgi:hypothetical protein
MKRNNPDRVEAGQIWLDEDGDHNIVLELWKDDSGDDLVEILVMSGSKAGSKFSSESLCNFAYKLNKIDEDALYFLECLS